MDPGHSSEYISAHWGALRAGHSVKLLPSFSVESVDSLRQKIIEEEPSVMLVSPNHSTLLQQSGAFVKKKDLLGQAFPEIFSNANMEDIGQPISVSSVPNLRFIIQTGFYNLPGFVKFRDMLVYRSNKYNTSSKISEIPVSSSKTKNKKDCPVNSFKTKLKKEANGEFSQNTVVYNLLDLQDHRSVQSLLGCLSLAQEDSLFTNVIPASNLEELLLENRFIQDLSESHNSFIVGNSQNLEKVKQNLQIDSIRYLDVSSQ